MTTPHSSPFSPLGPADPREVAGYEIRARIGSGGMGSVYLSFTRGGQPIALKVVRTEFADDPEFRRRFEAEVRAARQVQGLFTVPVLDSNTEGDAPWLATAFVPGLSLADVLRDHGPLPLEPTLLLVAGVAEALQSIHAAGVVHRDLKPGNVLLASDGPKVIDFGIARAADATPLTGSDVRIGTPSYMAPEQVTGRSAGAATDVFALGLIAHFAATGGHPFGEGAAHALMYRIVQDEPDLSATPEPLRELVASCLAKDPDARPTPAQIVELCRTLAPGQSLQRGEDWLPTPVADEVTHRIQAKPPAALPVQPAVLPVQPATPPPSPPATPPGTPATAFPATAPVTHHAGAVDLTPPPGGEQAKPANKRGIMVVAATAVVGALVGALIATQLVGGSGDDDPGNDARGGPSEQSTEPPAEDAGEAGDADGLGDAETGEDPEAETDGPFQQDPEGGSGDEDGKPGRPDDDPDSDYRLVAWKSELPIRAPVFVSDTDAVGGSICVGGNSTTVDLDALKVSYRSTVVSPTYVHMSYFYCDEPGLTDQGIQFNPELFVGLVDEEDPSPEQCYDAAHTPSLPNVITVHDIWEDKTLKEGVGLCFETSKKNVVLLWIDKVTADPHNKDLRTYLTSATRWERR